AERRGGRSRSWERRAEQAPDARAIPVAAGLGRGGVAEGEARAAADARHRDERAAHVGDPERQRYAGAPAADVEAAAGEVLQQAAGAGHQIAAVSAPDSGREVQPGRVDAAAGPRGRRGVGRRGGGRRTRSGELAVHVRSEVVDLRLDGALVDGGEAVRRCRRLRPGGAELGYRLTRARAIERGPLAGRLRVALEQATGLLAGRAELLRAALALCRRPGAAVYLGDEIGDEVVDLRLDRARIGAVDAATLALGLRVGRPELRVGVAETETIDRQAFPRRLRPALRLPARLLARRADLPARAPALRQGHAGDGSQEREAGERDAREFEPLNRHRRPPLFGASSGRQPGLAPSLAPALATRSLFPICTKNA